MKLKLKNKHAPPPLKPKRGYKRKAIREPSPEEPPPKKAKPPKDKGKSVKIPTKMPAKAPAKEPAKAPPEKAAKDSTPKDETAKAAVKSESPVAMRKPEPKVEGEEGEVEGIITAEVARQHGLPDSLIGTPLIKRKGPGRPPKDGVMSKRQRSQLIKQAKEIEKARAAGIDPADLPTPTVKPKIARRKESNAGEDDDIRETTEKGDGVGSTSDKKQAKPNKPPRTPSPEMRIEDYTEEQLQRPTANYVVLIHEAISSSPTGQMNLQQIYNYIERNYPWYKFKTTTSGWQSSVRHNLGQHDAFVKGDKEGKGYMWRINPSVSIEKERRKRQVSPPQVNQAQRQGYYPPPNAYPPPYGQPGYYPPPQGVPPNVTPRPPPSVQPVQPRLPPSLARNAESASQDKPSYTSPWAGGNVAGQPANQNPLRPYPPPTSQTSPAGLAAPPSGQYGVLYPTTAPPTSAGDYTSAAAYGGHYATSGPSPYSTPGRPYTPYPPSGTPSTVPPAPSATAPGSQTPQTSASQPQPPQNELGIPHPSGRYPLSTNPDLIRQLEAFRTVYLQTRIEPGEDKKVDNAIRAYVTPELAMNLTPQEQNLLNSIKSIPMLEQLRGGSQPIKQEEGARASEATVHVNGENKDAAPTAAASTAAAIAADAAAPSSNEPQKFTPNMTGPPPSATTPTPTPISAAVPAPMRVQTQRPSVEPLTPVPGSPAIQNGTPMKRPAPEAGVAGTEDTVGGAQLEVAKSEAEAVSQVGST